MDLRLRIICHAFVTCCLLMPGSRLEAESRASEDGGPEVRRLSDMGIDGDIMTEAGVVAVAAGGNPRRYLAVWQSDEISEMSEEFEVYGQMLDRNGDEIGANDFRISFQGGDGTGFDNDHPAVAWSSNANEFLVVWEGDTSEPPSLGPLQIWGQRINAATGAPISTNFRISDVGIQEAVFEPAIAYNADAGQYLVVWEENIEESPPNEWEIFGVRVAAGSGTVLEPAVRLTRQGPDGDADFDARNPRVAWNSATGEYLVVFEGTQSLELGELQEVEVFTQRVGADGNPIGSTRRISAMGVEGEAVYRTRDPDVAFHRGRSEYLVIWSSADDRGTLHPLELEIFGQRLNSSGSEIGEDDFRISFQGEDGNAFKDAEHPSLAWNRIRGSYLVSWQAPTDEGIEELEVFAQPLRGDGSLNGPALRLSNMGPPKDDDFAALRPAVAANGSLGDYFVAWEGDDDTLPLVDDEFEIFGRNVGEQLTLIFADGFESGDTSAWSSTTTP